MRIRLVFILLWLSYSPTFAQKKLPKYGDVAMEDLKMTTYELDTSAAAVILFDKGSSNLNDNGFPYKRHMRIKILKNSGLKWADHSLRVQRGSQSISGIKAATYNLEGGKVIETKMDQKSVFKTRQNKYVDQVKFTLPNVKVGSVIEFTYSISGGLVGWQFQYSIPVAWSEYEVFSSQYITLQKNMQGYLTLAAHEERGDGEYEHFTMSNIPAFKVEPFITTEDDYVSKINFYLARIFVPGSPVINYTKPWNEYAAEYNEAQEFGGQIRGSAYLAKTVEELTAGIVEPQKKLQVLYDYVKANVEWNGETDRIPDHPFKKVLESKKGSSSEINLMLISMLKKTDIPAVPVFISTRDNGLVRPFVNQMDQFNDVICMIKIKDKQIFVDATSRDLPINALPERCLNGQGLAMYEDRGDWVEIQALRSREVTSLDLKITEQGEMSGQLNISRDGIAGGDTRKSFRDMGEEKYTKAMLEGKSWEISKSEYMNMDKTSESIKEKYELVIRDHAQANGPAIYVNPNVVDRLEENQFKSESRLYPVDFATPYEKVYLCKIAVPETYNVEELPKPKLMTLPGNAAKFVFTASQNSGVISIMSQLTVSKSVFLADEYPNLREFFNQVVAKQAEQIVLKKK